MQPTNEHCHTADAAGLGVHPTKYTYSILIRNPPETWARKSEAVQKNFLQMMSAYTRINLRSPFTSEAYATCVKGDGRQYCYAFISTYNKHDGEAFIERIKIIVRDGIKLEAKWSSKSVVRAPDTPHQVYDEDTGQTQQWHPYHGLAVQSAQED